MAKVSMALSSENRENLHLRITGWNIEPQSIPLCHRSWYSSY
jgi:hypothetical protein